MADFFKTDNYQEKILGHKRQYTAKTLTLIG